jgi:hypothetical protein
VVFMGLTRASAGNSFAQDKSVCQEVAGKGVELREDYKNLSEVYVDLKTKLALAELLGGAETGIKMTSDVQKTK